MPALSQSLVFNLSTSVGNTGTTSVVYPNTGTTTLTYLSQRAKGDGYYGSSGGFHTVMYVGDQDFHGTVTMQATLASEPTESDWFTVDGTTISYNPLDVRTTSTVDSFNFVGNFVWVRSKIDIDAGSVYTVQYNH